MCTYQVGDRNENIVENSFIASKDEDEMHLLQQTTLAFAQKRLYESTTWPTVSATDIECLPYCHKGHNSIKKEGRNLEQKHKWSIRLNTYNSILTKKPIRNFSDKFRGGKGCPHREGERNVVSTLENKAHWSADRG